MVQTPSPIPSAFCAGIQFMPNMVERWFRDLTDKRIRSGVFRSVGELITAIEAHIQRHNSNPKPFVWTAEAEDIIAKYRRAKSVLEKVQTA